MAESLYNPFGDDDEDFEMDELLDRHLATVGSLAEGRDDPPAIMDHEHGSWLTSSMDGFVRSVMNNMFQQRLLIRILSHF